MKNYFIGLLVISNLGAVALVVVFANYHPISDKSYWAGFRRGLESNQELDSSSAYQQGYNDAMQARHK